jgi:nucleotide-binding universal stress UspA family protein
MKSVLLPVDQNDQMPATLETARLLADVFGATIEGVALRPAFTDIVAPDPIVAVTIPPTDWNEAEFTRSVRQTFDAFAAQHPGGHANAARFRWRGGAPIDDAALGSLGRVHDVTVIGRPGGRGARMTAIESSLFDSGRPVLMAPPVAPATLGETILIHWNASIETACCILFAMPILRKARRVSFIAVEGAMVQGPSIKDAVGYLEANGITASDRTVSGRNRAGEAILAEAAAIGADLLIKGAYTQSRLRQMIFGGATSHILAAAELPVFFAH